MFITTDALLHAQCDRTTSLNRFLDVVLEQCNGSSGGPTILGVVGCGCTEADLPVAEIVHRWNIPQVPKQRSVNLFSLSSVF